ncbi:MAG: hypothetical protein PVJ77_18780, partial [Desulfobacterales bacterium]
ILESTLLDDTHTEKYFRGKVALRLCFLILWVLTIKIAHHFLPLVRKVKNSKSMSLHLVRDDNIRSL